MLSQGAVSQGVSAAVGLNVAALEPPHGTLVPAAAGREPLELILEPQVQVHGRLMVRHLALTKLVPRRARKASSRSMTPLPQPKPSEELSRGCHQLAPVRLRVLRGGTTEAGRPRGDLLAVSSNFHHVSSISSLGRPDEAGGQQLSKLLG